MISVETAQTHPMPQTVEIEFAGAFVRGLCWSSDPNWIVLLHEPGSDLDAFGDVPALLAAAGYSVLAIDLPGDGLSDDPLEPRSNVEFIHCLADFMTGRGALKRFAIATGQVATAAALVSALDALVALSPTPLWESPASTPPVLIVVGGFDAKAVELANVFFRQLHGWAVFSSFGTDSQGTTIFRSAWGRHALEQTLAFLGDYRTGKPA